MDTQKEYSSTKKISPEEHGYFNHNSSVTDPNIQAVVKQRRNGRK